MSRLFFVQRCWLFHYLCVLDVALTVIATCANSGQGYVPSLLGWEHGGYSCDTTRFCPGSGEELAQHYVDMLTKLHG